jgi:diaminohydroxyphosphoribosylaminopyrimidine deaminase/5-amino-6-(5-phosphoribosylamino)uracil reductase
LNDLSKKYMIQALKIAFSRAGLTSPNPAVGAVVVKNGSVIGTGGTGPCGTAHAEVRAINDAASSSADLAGSEMFVTLEPCSHYGKTPPCAEAIIKAGIGKVNIAITDPNPLVSGKGIEMLKNAGVDVLMMNEFRQPAYDLIRGFEKLILKHRPFVISKSAVTLDGRIATSAGDSKWITGGHSRFIAHKLRAKSDAIIIGKKTYEADNPSLNVRFSDFNDEIQSWFTEEKFKFTGYDNFFLKSLLTESINEYKDPFRVIAGLPEIIYEDSQFFKDDNYVIVAQKDTLDRISRNGNGNILSKLNIEETGSMTGPDSAVYILEMLKGRGILNVMLEGGAGLNSSFLSAGEIDQFIYFIAPKISGNGISVLNNTGSEKMSEAVKLHDVSSVFISEDLLYNGYT